MLATLIRFMLTLALAPLLLGVINRTKAVMAGRKGQPILQPYYDLAKLLGKGAVYSRTTTWVFRLGPVGTLAAVFVASLIAPWGGLGAPVSFAGDFILMAYMLGLARFLTVIAALDTGSAFEGMGASREVYFSALAEPTLLISLIALARLGGSISLSTIYAGLTPNVWAAAGPALLLIVAALLVVVLAENARIPVDDPTTHLELTMIHEVMVLDHGGPDFAMIGYGAALKLWTLLALLAGLILPHTGRTLIDAGAFLGVMFALAIVIGLIESTMARLRLVRVPQMLLGAGALAVLAILLALR
ncbi:NADH-quinone oxidoreductase subunit H [bacterium]|nr:NADH-quinone oxidoreductase subunit H [bacterium]